MSGPARSLCENCGQPVHEEGRGWLHTETDRYVCADGKFAHGAGDTEQIIENAWREGYDFAYEEMTDAKSAEDQEIT